VVGRRSAMNLLNPQQIITLGKNTTIQIIIYAVIIIFMSNLNALVDAVLHPDIPYFDTEHLIVGGITGLVSLILFGLLALHVRYLNKALSNIKTLESILPICSNCKKIRKPDSDPNNMESWQPIEAYITARTTSQFSHGICPECAPKLYPQIYGKGRRSQPRDTGQPNTADE
jgi:hypothetical protein